MTTPAFRIIANGNDITDLIRDRLISLRVTDEAGQVSDSLEITVDDREKRMPLPRTGTWIRVWLGYSSNGDLPVYMGAYAVDECDLSCGPRSMVIRATAAATAPELIKEQRTQSWHQTTLGQVVTTIAERNNLEPVIKGSLASVEIKHEDQTSESDQAFLTRLAERHSATIKPADGKLVVVPRGKGGGISVSNLSGRITAGQATELARQAGFTGNDAVIMGAIAMAESRGNVRALNSTPPDLSYGLWQINMIGALGPERRSQLGLTNNAQLFDPATNARAARAIWQQQGFNAWSVYKSGAYRGYLTAAAQGSSSSILDRIFSAPNPISQSNLAQSLPGATIRSDEVTSWRATIKGRGAYGAVKARWLDRTTNKEQVKTAGDESEALPTFEEKQLHKTEEEAEAAAESRLQSLRSGEVRVSITMPGRPELSAEELITLEDFRPEIDGTWNIKTITHTLDTKGYSMVLECGTQGDENDDWTLGQSGGDSFSNSQPDQPRSTAGGTKGVIARTGSSGDSTGPHLDARWADGRRITAADADRYLRINGKPPSSFGVTSQYGPRSLYGRSFHAGIDFGTPTGSAISLINGASYDYNMGNTGAGGYAVQISTPEGKMRLLHLLPGSAR
jgi:phage protein D